MRKAARRIVEKLRLQGHDAVFAGGWVRDFLLHRRSKDIDIATSARPDEILRLFPNARSIGAQFGVIQVLMYGHAYEVATFRSDREYLDGRHPFSVTYSGPEQDALRRDFTINGLFYDPVGGRIIDYVNGSGDIRSKRIRTIGDPSERFAEDKLRMMRAIRFSCNLGFRIVPETWNAIRRFAPDILQVSWERIRDELIQLFRGPAPGTGLDLLYESGLLTHILPEIGAMRGIPQVPASPAGKDVFVHTRTALAMLHKPSAVLALGTLLHDSGKTSTYAADTPACYELHAEAGVKISERICRRLRMSNEETDRIVDLVATHMDFAQADGLRVSGLRRLLRKSDIADHLELFRVNCLSSEKSLDTYWMCRRKLHESTLSPAGSPLINGKDLIDMGYSPGPIFKEILRTIEDLQLEEILRTREEAVRHIRSAFPIKDKI